MERVCEKLKDKIMNAEQLICQFKSNMTVGFSGFTLAGYPKIIPKTLANSLDISGLTVYTGASVGDQLDGEFARNNIISRRYPYQSNKDLRKSINEGNVEYEDIHLGKLAKVLEQNKIEFDIVVIECTAVLEEGLVPTYSMGISDILVKRAKKIIIEINTTVPVEIFGMHDCFSDYKNVPIKNALEKIGTPYIECDLNKIIGIVFSEEEDIGPTFKSASNISEKIGENIIKFLETEIRKEVFDNTLLPLQSGIGSIANAVFSSIGKKDFHDLVMYTEVCQDSALELLERGVIKGISSSALCLSKEARQRVKNNMDWYKERIVLRPQEISNCGEVINRLDVISINTPLEIDIYGNVNSTHILGRNIVNGIGGSADFSRNARICIFAAPSVTKNGSISTIVPMVTHIDHTEHDVHVVITEQGIADLRCKAPRERAIEIIDNCAHPDFRDKLHRYYDEAVKEGSGHIPHNLKKAFSFHINYIETGKM